MWEWSGSKAVVSTKNLFLIVHIVTNDLKPTLSFVMPKTDFYAVQKPKGVVLGVVLNEVVDVKHRNRSYTCTKAATCNFVNRDKGTE